MATTSACESRSQPRGRRRNASDELRQGLGWSQDCRHFNVKLNTGVSSFFRFSLETNRQTLTYRQALGIASWQEEEEEGEVFDGGGVCSVAVEQQGWQRRGDRSPGHACGGQVMRFCVCHGNGPLGWRIGKCGCGGTEELGKNEEQNKTEKNNPSLSSFRTCM